MQPPNETTYSKIPSPLSLICLPLWHVAFIPEKCTLQCNHIENYDPFNCKRNYRSVTLVLSIKYSWETSHTIHTKCLPLYYLLYYVERFIACIFNGNVYLFITESLSPGFFPYIFSYYTNLVTKLPTHKKLLSLRGNLGENLSLMRHLAENSAF